MNGKDWADLEATNSNGFQPKLDQAIGIRKCAESCNPID